jgi:HEPN domain-containing protein
VEWLNRARSNFAQAKSGIQVPEVYLEDLCFQAQQAAEKAIKAILISLDLQFPYTHDIADLLTLIEKAGQDISPQVRKAARLSDYAVEARYPGVSEAVDRDEYEEAISIANEVMQWAEELIKAKNKGE